MRPLDLEANALREKPVVSQGPQHRKFTQRCYADYIQMGMNDLRETNIATKNGWMRPNGPASQARQSRYLQWHLARRPLWSRLLWQLSHLAAASARLADSPAVSNPHRGTSQTNPTATHSGVA